MEPPCFEEHTELAYVSAFAEAPDGRIIVDWAHGEEMSLTLAEMDALLDVLQRARKALGQRMTEQGL